MLSTYHGNLAIEMYGKRGNIDEAVAAFESIQHKNTYSWNILAVAFAANGYLLQARETFNQNPYKNNISWTAMLASYTKAGRILEAEELFDSMPEKTTSAWNAMITGYAKAGDLASARVMFDSMPQKDIVSWNAMIAAYSNSGSNHINAKILFDRAPQRNLVTWTAMLRAYARRGEMAQAQALFDQMPSTNVVSWTCLMTGYAEAGQDSEVILKFKMMDQSGCHGDHTAFVTVIDACAKVVALEEGAAIHDHVTHLGLVTDAVLGSVLVTLYGRCGMVNRALQVFHGILRKSVVSWSAMISALAQNGCGAEAIQFFRMMEIAGMHPNRITLVSVFDACASIPEMTLGKLLHSEFSSELETDDVLATAVINMYGEGGGLDLARQVFESCGRTDVVSWTAMMTAYARNGFWEKATELLQGMLLCGVSPNQITLVSLLSICNHSGKLDDGLEYFQLFVGEYDIAPAMEHYVCMVDLLARSGRMREAEDLTASMPFEPHPVVWNSLLSSCRISKETAVQMKCAAELVQVPSRDEAVPYMLLNAAN